MRVAARCGMVREDARGRRLSGIGRRPRRGTFPVDIPEGFYDI